MRRFGLGLLLSLVAVPAIAQSLPFPTATDTETLTKAMPSLVRFVAHNYRNEDRSVYLETIFRVRLVEGDYADAIAKLTALIASRAHNPSPLVRARDIQYLVYARAMVGTIGKNTPFDTAYGKEFHAIAGTLDNRTSANVVNILNFDNLDQAKRALAGDLARQKGKTTIAMGDAVQLIRDYNDVQAYSALAARTPALVEEDDARRYAIEKDIAVRTPDSAIVCVLVVRPRHAPRLPALLQFTIYNDPDSILREARRVASNDYVGVVGLTRGKGCSSGQIVPYEHDGGDADAVIDWIAKQPWSDGRVGMYGGSYSGFTTWAAMKHKPAALKAVMVGAPNAPGIDSPMEDNVFWNFLYPWPFYTTNNKTLDNATYNDNARWQKLDHDWYVSGRAYRDLDKIDGTPNPIFDRWVSHGSYDAYWQNLIPYRHDFAQIGIPMLMTAGYYYGGPGAATYYLDQYQKYDPKAEAYLVIGPYDHFMAQRGTATPDGDVKSMAGYNFDPVALANFTELRFAWFDYVLKGAPKPSILADHVNYEVTGANVWKHAPSLAGMAHGHLRFYLSASRSSNTYRLTDAASGDAVSQTIDFKDRSDVDKQIPGGGVLDKDIDTTNALEFVSDPFGKSTELSGFFSGHLEFIANKKDFDFQISLYAQMRDGKYLQLAPYWSRASYVADIAKRKLLLPGKRETLDFHAIQLMSALLPAGSRLIAVLGVIKNSGQEINYGTGGTVAAETIADAKVPLKIEWFGNSAISVPLGR